MVSEIKRLLRVRKAKEARFKREGVDKKVTIKDSWRRPRGLHSKQRKLRKAKGPHPDPGYGSPLAVRGMHPCGLREVRVCNLKDIEGVDAATQAIRIGATVGLKKREIIQNKAAEAKIRVLNWKDATKPVSAGKSASKTVKADASEEEE
ncbi:MAG: 50S ribosomal protein L32e [Methanospirillum sp.]|uniref:50S ribosomal protein L32e n=1 Tax=Methanospirillum sp. TaxID=45200 RepID=UPI002372D5CF|nr:50S ribosomal protein L32e [Methanospirillum sp.]MDD1727723.1 50S ribosomal protein L32e [Methanospirillum sp.]